jgi:hypothetical protein
MILVLGLDTLLLAEPIRGFAGLFGVLMRRHTPQLPRKVFRILNKLLICASEPMGNGAGGLPRE